MTNLTEKDDSKAGLFAISGGFSGGKLQQGYSLPKGIVTASSIIPSPVQAIISSQFANVGLNFDISKLALNKDNRETVRQLMDTVELIQNNADMLPKIAGCLKKAMKAATKQAKFNADIAKSALIEQLKIDKAQADVLMALMGYNQGRSKIEAKLERKFQQQQRITEAQTAYDNESWGAQNRLIKAKYDFFTDVALKRVETREKQEKANADRQVRREQWKQDVV
jgi:hypothetical protein